MGLDWDTWGVLADFRRCQITSQHTDLVFHCANGKVSAHQMIFAGISRLFNELMQRYLIGQELIPFDLNISLPEIRREHVERVVEMVYTGQVRLTKSDYPAFREICQLLELCVPIGDYDAFYMSQCDDNDAFRPSNDDVQDFEPSMPEVSIPLKSCLDLRVFVCDLCYAMFPLKFALKRHRQIRHGETESCDLRTAELTGSPEVSNPSTVKSVNKRQRFSTIDHDDERSNENVQNCVVSLPVLPIPLNSLLDQPIFVCNQCYVTFSSKVALKRHKNSQHGETESLASITTSVAGSPEVPNISTVKRVSKRQRSSTMNKRLFFSPNDEPTFECPDCLKRLPSNRILHHVFIHLDKDLSEFIEDSQSVPGLEKCKLCTYESSLHRHMRTHVGVTHKMLLDLANKAQMNFLRDAGGMFARLERSSSKPNKVLPTKKVQTMGQNLQNDAFAEMSDIENCSDLEDTNGIESPQSKVSKKSRIDLNPSLSPPKPPIEAKRSLKRPSKPQELLPEKKLKTLQTRNRILQKDDLPETSNIEENNALEHATNTGTPRREVSTQSWINPNPRQSNAETQLLPPKPLRKLYTLRRGRILVKPLYARNGEDSAKCPDCRRRVLPHGARDHLARHMGKCLRKFVTKVQSRRGGFKCILCGFKTRTENNAIRHVGVPHNLIMSFANEAQKQFLFDSKMKQKSTKKLKCPPSQLLPRNKKNQSKESRSFNFLEEEDLSQGESNDGNIETEAAVEDEDLSQRQNSDSDIETGTVVEDEDPSQREGNNGDTEKDNALDDEDLSKMPHDDYEIELDDALVDRSLSTIQDNDCKVEIFNSLEDEDTPKTHYKELGKIENNNALEVENLSKLQDTDCEIETDIVVKDEDLPEIEDNDDSAETLS